MSKTLTLDFEGYHHYCCYIISNLDPTLVLACHLPSSFFDCRIEKESDYTSWSGVCLYIYIHLFISFQEGAVTARGPNLFCCYFFLFLVEFDIKSLRIYQMIFYDDFENVIITGISIMLSKLLIKVSVYSNINASINDCQVYLNDYRLWSYRLI